LEENACRETLEDSRFDIENVEGVKTSQSQKHSYLELPSLAEHNQAMGERLCWWISGKYEDAPEQRPHMIIPPFFKMRRNSFNDHYPSKLSKKMESRLGRWSSLFASSRLQ